MSTKTIKGDAVLPLSIEDDERHVPDVEDFIARNRDTLNASIRQSRADVAAGRISTKSVDDIIAEGRKRREK